MSPAKRLKEIREREEKSQDEFIEDLPVSIAAYRNYEGGKRTIPTDLVTALYEQYNVDPTWLILGHSPNKDNFNIDEICKIGQHLNSYLEENNMELKMDKYLKILLHLYALKLAKGLLEKSDYRILTSIAV